MKGWYYIPKAVVEHILQSTNVTKHTCCSVASQRPVFAFEKYILLAKLKPVEPPILCYMEAIREKLPPQRTKWKFIPQINSAHVGKFRFS